MISAKYYRLVYLIVVSILTLIIGSRYSSYPSNRVKSSKREPPLLSLVLMVMVTLFIGLRPLSGKYFIDMRATAIAWLEWNEGVFHFSLDRTNFIYDNIRIFMATSGFTVESFFMLVAVIYFVMMWIACRKLFPNDTLFAFLICLAAFSTFSYATNGIKAGSAASIFLVALAYRDNLKISIPLAVISWGFHHSMIMVLCSYVVVLFIKNPKFYFALWMFSFVVAVTHISAFQRFFASIADEGGEEYLSDFIGSGFRIDFILYSAIPVLVGYFAVFKRGIRSRMYDTILSLYLMTNSIWMLCIYAAFTNRIAYLSWFLYPVVLIYPFLKEKWSKSQFNTARLVAYGHLAFTLFMSFIYY